MCFICAKYLRNAKNTLSKLLNVINNSSEPKRCKCVLFLQTTFAI